MATIGVDTAYLLKAAEGTLLVRQWIAELSGNVGLQKTLSSLQFLDRMRRHDTETYHAIMMSCSFAPCTSRRPRDSLSSTDSGGSHPRGDSLDSGASLPPRATREGEYELREAVARLKSGKHSREARPNRKKHGGIAERNWVMRDHKSALAPMNAARAAMKNGARADFPRWPSSSPAARRIPALPSQSRG